MKVIAEEPWDWFLFDDDGIYYLNVLVEHGAVSYDVTAQLNADQVAVFTRDGKSILMQLASDMRRQALMRQWRASPLPAGWDTRSVAAAHEWQRRHRAAGTCTPIKPLAPRNGPDSK